MKFLNLLIALLIFFSCSTDEETTALYSASGKVLSLNQKGLAGIKIYYSENEYVTTDINGAWRIENQNERITLKPNKAIYNFSPASLNISHNDSNIVFIAELNISEKAQQTFNWFKNIQLTNGLLESAENSNSVSLYDNALSAMVFVWFDEYERAEKVFDFFTRKIQSEFSGFPGGFAQFRDRHGNITWDNRWIGDNAWLLMALNNYKKVTGSNNYDILSSELETWIRNRQDEKDGGVWGGFNDKRETIGKVTEANIDVFNAIEGFDNFHSGILKFLKNNRWDESSSSLIAGTDLGDYNFAMDIHPWSYCSFEGFPSQTLNEAD